MTKPEAWKILDEVLEKVTINSNRATFRTIEEALRVLKPEIDSLPTNTPAI